jgi:hypothetical protein
VKAPHNGRRFCLEEEEIWAKAGPREKGCNLRRGLTATVGER